MMDPIDYRCFMDPLEARSFVESLLVFDELIYADQSQENNSSGLGSGLDKEGDFGDSPSIMSLPGDDIYVSVEKSVENVEMEDSWSMVDDLMLRAALADNNILMQPPHVIQWNHIAEALPWRTPSEVFNRTNQLLQTVLHDLAANFTTEQHQHQQQEVGMSPPSEQQKQQGVRKMWSEEEHQNFLVGIERYGWGNWKKVATLVPSRTVPQITSHAQNYLKHNNPNNRAKNRTRNN